MKKTIISFCIILACLAVAAQEKGGNAKKAFSLDDAKDIFEKNASQKITPVWDEALSGLSADGRFSTWIVPMKGSQAERMVIQKDLEAGNATIYVLNAVPAEGLKEGESFSGTVQYTHINTRKRFAWEQYEKGKIIYCKDLRYEGAEDPTVSDKNLETRLSHNPSYLGKTDPFDAFNWRVIAANRPRKGEASFSADRTQKSVIRMKDGPKVQVSSSFSFGNIAKALENVSGVIYYMNVRQEKENPGNPNGKKTVTVEATFTNEDFCDYYVKTESGQNFSVNTGKAIVNTYSNMQDAIAFNTGLGVKKYYKGHPLSKADTSFVYAFPVKNGEKTTLEKDRHEKARCYAVRMKPGDDITAMRSGIVCKFTDKKNILIYHADGTFSAYLNLGELKVSAGDRVTTGDIIATCGLTSPSVAVFYLRLNKDGNPVYKSVIPYFRSESGDTKPVEGTEFVAKIDTDLIIKDMSKSAQKKYLKQKGL